MRLIAIITILALGVLASSKAADAGDASKAPPQAYLPPSEVEKIQDTALAELLKLRPDLKAEELEVTQLMYILTPDPDYSIHEQKDGTRKKVWLSSNYQELSVTYIIRSAKREEKEGERNTIVRDTAVVHFPNARYDKFSVSKGTSTEYR